MILSPSPEEGRGGRPQLGRASRVSVELGTAGGCGAEGGAGEGTRQGSPPPSHAPPCYVRSSRTSSESRRWGQQDAGGSRGGRPGASAARLAGPGAVCAAAGASTPAPTLPMQPWQCLRRFALAWWERTAEGSSRSPREEAGPKDPGGRREPGEQEPGLRKEGIPDCLPLSPRYSCSPQLQGTWGP